MNLKKALSAIKQALESPVETWPEYTPVSIPIAIFDKSNVVYLNHPNPPQTRPEHLLAATATNINGIRTATIPIEICPDEQTLIPLLYHECFHVFQESGRFHFNEQYNFFKALSYYPELNGTHRALCIAETEILNEATLTINDKAKSLATLAKQRHKILSKHEELMVFERISERKEGTASFVEQQAYTQIFKKLPSETITTQFGWSRQYSIGAAACQLLDALVKDWQTLVESSQTPTEILIQKFAHKNHDISGLCLTEKIVKENEAVDGIYRNIQTNIDKLMKSGVLRVQFPHNSQLIRSFNPKNIISMGDGRLIHTKFLNIQMSTGHINVQGNLIIEDYNKNELILPIVPFQTISGKIEANTDAIQFCFSGSANHSKNIIQVDND